MRHPLRSLLLAAGLLLIFTGCSTSQRTNQQAACVGPEVEASPVRVAPGEDIGLAGERFFTGCEDVIVDGEPVDEERPEKNIEIELRQGSREWRLAVVDASEDYSFAARLQVPEEVESGKATIIADSARTTLVITGG